MNWDVFVSHASEDKPFARRLVRGLERAGLRVWFDESVLEVGDSLRRSIDKGLSESRYGVVILSENFFNKEWPQRELDGLTARDDGNSKVILPVWYKLSVQDVRKYSPVLSDKLSINSNGSVKDVVAKILRAIHKDNAGVLDWSPLVVSLSNQLEISVLPIRPIDGKAVCISRFPITNSQYRTFTEEANHQAPVGKEYKDGAWVGPYLPWSSEQFSNPDKPVVCVSYWDALGYCKWLAQKNYPVFLPPANLWDYAAGLVRNTSGEIPVESLDFEYIHHNSSSPAMIDKSGGRDNIFGVSDMVGNIWEWVNDAEVYRPIQAVFVARRPKLRGGGFLDDIRKVRIKLRASMLDDEASTSHTDLGFRICTLFPLSDLPIPVRNLLASRPHTDSRLHSGILDAIHGLS